MRFHRFAAPITALLRVLPYSVAASLVTLTLVGCRDAARSVSQTAVMSVATAEPAPLVPRLIVPQTTAPEITWIGTVNPQFNHHYVWLDPSQVSNPKLFVFMPGAGGRPRGYQRVQQEAARLGYHVIGLMYQNDVAVVENCSGSPDPDCSGNMRLEMIDGVDRSPLLDVNQANSIDNRLTKLLLYLAAQYPDERWGRFLEEGVPKWSQIAFGGHSLGAAQAALIGKIRQVERVVMLSGPTDVQVPDVPDAWVSIGETPAAKYFGLFHQREPFAQWILRNLRTLELDRFGESVAPDLAESPYGGTHILATDLEPQGGYSGTNAHRSTAIDFVTPLDADGTPLLRAAWRYMLGETPLGPR